METKTKNLYKLTMKYVSSVVFSVPNQIKKQERNRKKKEQ